MALINRVNFATFSVHHGDTETLHVRLQQNRQAIDTCVESIGPTSQAVQIGAGGFSHRSAENGKTEGPLPDAERYPIPGALNICSTDTTWDLTHQNRYSDTFLPKTLLL